MSIALEIRGLSKRYVVGVGGCLAIADVLRGVDVVLRAGETLIVVGSPGSGKSTLMLCAAGLLTADAGELRWFGESSRASAVRRALYHHSSVDMMRSSAMNEPHVHLLDVPAIDEESRGMDEWISERCDRGDAVLVGTRSEAVASRLGARVLTLRGGRLHAARQPAARVAEHVRD
jgi:ABC-type sulfate/molybdate transport systems ATPase subunit